MKYVKRWPHIRYWMFGHESNIDIFYRGINASTLAAEVQASALAAWYVNPAIVVIRPGLAAVTETNDTGTDFRAFFAELYLNGIGPWTDTVSLHPFNGNGFAGQAIAINQAIDVMTIAGDGNKRI